MQFAVALLASAVIVLGSPFMGQLQSFLRRSLSTKNYVLFFGVGVMAAVGLLIVIAFLRIRERRAQRSALMLIALLFGGTYMWWTATPFAEVNAVERVHFVEYGLIAFLCYRASLSRRSLGEGGSYRGDPSILILPLLAAFTVGTCDEWLQWFIPYRVGEAHDVFINLASIVCGVLFALAIRPPAAFSARLHPASWRGIGMVSAMVWLIFAAFVSQAHLGHMIDVPDIGKFKSHYSAARLNELQLDRAARWKTAPPIAIRRLSREDQYLDEGLWHVRRRNGAEVDEAWRENLILERFFVPVLDLPTYASPNGNRWPPEQRADFGARANAAASFVSTAESYPLVAWPRTAYWIVVLVIAAILVLVPRALSRRSAGS
ncbi:MAG: VanZ family protein [Cyanobacteria bacterium]|nr:VanZ family protein [Cyanobacteriota bacterium]